MVRRMIRTLLAAAIWLACISSADASAKKPHLKPIACAIVLGAGGGSSGWRIAQGPCRKEVDKAHVINARKLGRGSAVATELVAARRRVRRSLQIRCIPPVSTGTRVVVIAHQRGQAQWR